MSASASLANTSTINAAASTTSTVPKTELGGIVVLDFGGQYTQLIARRIREQQVFSAILPCTASLAEIHALAPVGVILSGGPSSVYDAGAPKCDPEVLNLGVPVLGICYGLQWIAHTLGGEVSRAGKREYGRMTLDVADTTGLLAGFPKTLSTWNNHGDHVLQLPKGFRCTGRTDNAISAAEDSDRRIYAVQFHPEVKHTERGTDVLRNFVFQICHAQAKWSGGAFITETVASIRQKVGDDRVICALSGGVDSAVAAVLVGRAIGEKLTNIFVDTGLLRKNEYHDTLELLRDRMGLNVIGVDASERFLTKLKGVTDPEQKRKIIGREFIAVFVDEAKKLANAAAGKLKYLVQGTLYPDVIESVSVKGPSAVIKTHHNVGGLPADMPFSLIEPLRDLFKDEVRRIGAELGLPAEMLKKHPFPGPGLAVRLLGEVTPERLAMLREADAIVTDEIRKAGLYDRIWQAFAVLLPVQSVGIMGDGRSYGWTVAVRAVESEDAMTADWCRLPSEVLEKISSRISNEVTGINRVVYDISSKPPGTIEWE